MLQRLSGFAIDDSYGNLLSFSLENDWGTLIQQHNEADGEIHLDLYAPVFICHEFDAVCDIILINISSQWWATVGCSTLSALSMRDGYFN
jgi:hypothetical protein